MTDIWQPGKGIMVKELSNSIYVFQFYHYRDLKKVVDGGPWTYDNHLLILHQLKPGENPLKVPLFFANFWLQVYDVRAGYMSVAVGRQLGNFYGRFIEYDSKGNAGIWISFMRIRVCLDVCMPLKRFKVLKTSATEMKRVNFKYERLPPFCYICGLLGHTDHNCGKYYVLA